MSDIKDWSETAGTNTYATPNGAPEGWAPSSVNAVYREGMAATRRFYGNIEWREFASDSGASPTGDCHTATYASATTFDLASGDGDVTAIYHSGRRIRVVATTPGTIYGTIVSSTHSTTTTVTVDWDTSTEMSSEAITVSLGVGQTGYPVSRAWQQMLKQEASADSTIEFIDGTNGVDFSVFDQYAVVMSEISVGSINSYLSFVVSQAASYVTTGYVWHAHYFTSSSNTPTGTSSGVTGPTTYCPIVGPYLSTNLTKSGSGILYINKPRSTTSDPSWLWDFEYENHGNTNESRIVGSGRSQNSAAAVDKIKFSSGTSLTGTLELYGIG